MYRRNPNSALVYRKALELCEVSRAIASYVSVQRDSLLQLQSNSHRDIIANSLLTDAELISAHIEQAEQSDSHAFRLNSVRFVSIMTKNILSYCNGLEKDGLKEKEYLNLLRREIKSFRKYFKTWRLSLLRGGETGSWGMDGIWTP